MSETLLIRSTRIALRDPSKADDAGAFPPVVQMGKGLNFAVQRQEQTQWCWAAVAASISEYFEGDALPGQLNWKWCNKCQGLVFAANGPAPCSGGGNHDHRGSGNYSVMQNDPSAEGQRNWRWCNQCQNLTFAGHGERGACAAGGSHDHDGSGNYVLVQNVEPKPDQQDNWRFCRKCQGLAFAGNVALGLCPAGGTHDHEGSGNYLLTQIIRPQCPLVNAMFDQTRCCEQGGSEDCNRPASTRKALHDSGHLAAAVEGAASYERLKEEIDAGRPLAARIAWDGTDAGHAVVVDGYRLSGPRHVAVEDPWYGASDWHYDELVNGYQGAGTWSHSYFTR